MFCVVFFTRMQLHHGGIINPSVLFLHQVSFSVKDRAAMQTILGRNTIRSQTEVRGHRDVHVNITECHESGWLSHSASEATDVPVKIASFWKLHRSTHRHDVFTFDHS